MTNSEILFKETQRFRQWWLILVLVAANAVVAFTVIYASAREPIGEKSISTGEIILVTTISLLISLMLFFVFRLDTMIKQDGVYVKFFPFHLKYRYYTWNQISKVWVRIYNPMGEYGGWGIRFGFGNGKAYNVSGNKGLQLELTNGKKLLIGTNKPAELQEVINKVTATGIS